MPLLFRSSVNSFDVSWTYLNFFRTSMRFIWISIINGTKVLWTSSMFFLSLNIGSWWSRASTKYYMMSTFIIRINIARWSLIISSETEGFTNKICSILQIVQEFRSRCSTCSTKYFTLSQLNARPQQAAGSPIISCRICSCNDILYGISNLYWALGLDVLQTYKSMKLCGIKYLLFSK